MKKNDILVFSIALKGYSKLFESCLETQKSYCSRWGYQYFIIDKEPRKLKAAEAAWLKLYLLKQALKCNYKWIAFLDADCEVRQHTPSFVEEMSNFNVDKSIFMAHGFSGRINSGVIFLKNTRSSINYLHQVIENRDKEVSHEDKALYENGHIIHYAKGNSAVQIIDQTLWNNNQIYNENSYIQHYSGGILRNKYLENTRQLKKNNIINRILKKISPPLFKKDPSQETEDLKELLQFYTKTYPSFNCGANN